VFAFSFN
jgi:CTD nuclear envelope phosphatase 1